MECGKDVVFILTREDVIACAKKMDIPEEAISDDVMHQVKKGVEFGLDCWTEVVETALKEALVLEFLAKLKETRG